MFGTPGSDTINLIHALKNQGIDYTLTHHENTAAYMAATHGELTGVPGVVVKTRNNFVANRLNAFIYHYNALAYARGEHRAWDSPAFEQARKAEQASLETELAELEKI